MSLTRQNVTWESADGTWSRASFYVTYCESDPDDVEYDYTRFDWASIGHGTEQEATRSWEGINAGGGWFEQHSPSSADQCAEYDRMARQWLTENPGK